MPNLVESLQGRDLGHLRIVAEYWGIELEEQDLKAATAKLTSSMLSLIQDEGLINNLSASEKDALTNLAASSGRLPWAQFSRQYGEIREMGVAKRDRDQPYKQPASTAEALWYKGLLARAFFDSPAGPEEFAYLPDDLLAQIPLIAIGETSQYGRRASSSEYARIALANDLILDHACTYLAAIRQELTLESPFMTHTGEELTPGVIKPLLQACGLIDPIGALQPEPVRLFLESSREEALLSLYKGWRQSSQFNELQLLPGLSTEGNWVNDPLGTRQAILGHLSSVPHGTWWSVHSFVTAIKKRDPDFQRPAGDYDSWFIRDDQSGEFLRGFSQWDAVEGRLIRFILTGPLYWMGVVDLASPEGNPEVTAFRLSGWSKYLLKGEAPRGLPVEDAPIIVRSDATVNARRLVPRRVRYQLARFCDWVKETPDEYQYQITAVSLREAQKQGLKVSQLVQLLNRYAKVIPPTLLKALERWEASGTEARLERVLILRVTSAEVLQALRKSRASRFLGEPLGQSTVIIKPGAARKVLAALAELGYLGEIRGEVEDK